MSTFSFLIFLTYITLIFFLPNSWWVLMPFTVNGVMLSALLATRPKDFPNIVRKTLSIIPFILFVAVFNWLLDSYITAIWVGLKLLIVCNTAAIYASTTSITKVARTIARLCAPLRRFGINQDDIVVLISLAFMMIPVFRRELRDLRHACLAKGLPWNFTTARVMLQRLCYSTLRRVNQIEESLDAKGYKGS